MRRVAHTTGVDHDGIDELLLASKQDALKVNGQPISSVVLDTFTIGGSEENNAANSLLTAKAIEDWFEQVNQHLVMISPGQQGPSVRVGSINASSPSTLNVPSCAAVSSLVNTKTTPQWAAINSLQSSKVDQSLVASSMLASNLSSSNLVTEGAILNFIGSAQLNESGTPIIRVQPKLYARSITDVTDPSFSYIKAGVHDNASGYDETKDNRIATMACTHNHITSQISASKVSPTFSGTVTLPPATSVQLNYGIFTRTLDDYIKAFILDSKAGVGLNLASCETTNFATTWSTTTIPSGFGINALQQLAITSTGQIKVIRDLGQSGGDDVVYIPPKIQQLQFTDAWVQDLPSNINVIHADILTGSIYVLGASTTELDINWALPIQRIVANDVWTGVTYAIPNDHRVLAYNNTSKGVCVLIRSTDTTTYTSISWFDLSLFNQHIDSKIGSFAFASVDMGSIVLANNSALQSPLTVSGLGVLNSTLDTYRPVYCSDVYIGGDSTSMGNQLTGLLWEAK